MHLLGIDIGGTKTSVCVGTDKGDVLSSRRMTMKDIGSMDAYFRSIRELAGQALAEAGRGAADIAAVGISAPGPMNVREGILISPPNNPGWRQVPIVQELREMFNVPVYLNNDANAAALAEYLFGKYRGVRNMIYLTFSTGMGGGIIVNGQLIQGATDMGGEVGHQTLDPNGPKCGCGKNGCFEAYVGGMRVADRLKEQIAAGGITTSMVAKAGGRVENIDAKVFVEAAREGDAFALAAWDEFTERLAQGVGNLIMIINPELVIMGTIAVHEGEFVLEPLRRKLKKYVWPWALDACRIVPSSCGDGIANLAALAVAISCIGAQKA